MGGAGHYFLRNDTVDEVLAHTTQGQQAKSHKGFPRLE